MPADEGPLDIDEELARQRGPQMKDRWTLMKNWPDREARR
jgi:hypothetical protein